VNSLAQAGALGALNDREFYDRTRFLVQTGKKQLERGLVGMGLSPIPTQTNFFLIKVPQKAQIVYEALLKKGVIIRSMQSYGLEDYIRVNIGLPEENKRFLRALKQVVEKPDKNK
jgi:histidinol-phosphate aminotransferase